jgi:large subunit ribosomal protein L30
MVNIEKTISLTLVRSKFGRKPGHRECVEGLGLRHLHHTVKIKATACNLGMINKVKYLLKIQDN